MRMGKELRATRYLKLNTFTNKTHLKKNVINVSRYITIRMRITLIDIDIPINLWEFVIDVRNSTTL